MSAARGKGRFVPFCGCAARATLNGITQRETGGAELELTTRPIYFRITRRHLTLLFPMSPCISSLRVYFEANAPLAFQRIRAIARLISGGRRHRIGAEAAWSF